ncbi:MAG TPA: phosphate signaling complex protein PhoU [Bacteroidota bacterium]|nr:phosphate signaling complex protein PhoU [Bacteroidota bacterium]
MERHFQKELEGLKTSLIKMGSVVEESIKLSTHAFLTGDMELAQRVIDSDNRINSLELEIDNAIIDLLALQQPVARDLRFIIAAQKINNDLERLGDHAVNIAESAVTMKKLPYIEILDEIPTMADVSQKMLKDALDGFILLDAALARSVLISDDQIDEMNRQVTKDVIELLKPNPQLIECGLELIRVSRNLERVADLTTNIAEEVIFQTQARVVKHHAEEKTDPPLLEDKRSR